VGLLPRPTRRRALVAKAAAAIGKSPNTLRRWSAQHDWVLRAAAWDAEQDKAGRQARLDAVERLNREQLEVGELMLRAVRDHIEDAALSLARSPHALVVWAQTAVHLQQDALGITGPRQGADDAAERDARQKDDDELQTARAHLPPAMVIQLRDISLEMTKLKSQYRHGFLPTGSRVPE